MAPKTNSDYWEPKIERNRARDLDTDSALSDAGWTVMRFWAHEDPGEVAAAICREVRSRRQGDSNG